MGNANRIFEVKKPSPTSPFKYVGVEIEFFCPVEEDQVAEAFRQANLDRYVTLKGDGSITPTGDCTGYEIAVLTLQHKYKSILQKVCSVLSLLNAQVNTSCGLHVHIDCRKRNVREVYTRMYGVQNLLYALMPQSRRDNTYCLKAEHAFFDDQVNVSSRYRGINLQAFLKFHTLEIRMHAGTTQASKIINWVELLLAVSDAKVMGRCKTVEELQSYLKLDKDLVSYFKARYTKFNETEESINV